MVEVRIYHVINILEAIVISISLAQGCWGKLLNEEVVGNQSWVIKIKSVEVVDHEEVEEEIT